MNDPTYNHELQMLSTNTMLNMRTGNVIIDTLLSIILASALMYFMQCKDMFMKKTRRLFKRCFQERYAVRHQGRIYMNRMTNEALSETFLALKDWIITGIHNDEFLNAHTLCEIQVPRSLTHVMESLQDTALGNGNNDPSDESRKAFSRSIMVMEQMDAIKHKKFDIYVRHEMHTVGDTDMNDTSNHAYAVANSTRNEYVEHTITLSSNNLSTKELVAFVKREVLEPFQERRRRREKNKLFYYLFENHNVEDENPSYEKYEWRSTKTFSHVISEHTDTVKRRIDQFINNREWYERHGKPYSLTMLLHGPPGCGKTSLIKAVANYTKRHIKEIPLPRVKNRQTLMEIFHGTHIGFRRVRPQDCIYVFEEFDKMGDIVHDENQRMNNPHQMNAMNDTVTNANLSDAVHSAMYAATHSNRGCNKSTEPPPLSLGDILNVMDGILENDGIITFFTANQIGHLHEAITRPGRIDLKLELGKATTTNVKKLLGTIYGIAPDVPCRTLDSIDDDDVKFHKKWSPAEIEEICFCEPSLERAVDTLRQQIEQHGR